MMKQPIFRSPGGRIRSPGNCAALLVILLLAGACDLVPIPFVPPERTNWEPEGCRVVEATDPVLGDRAGYRNLHSDAWQSDEVTVALNPMFELTWVAEPNTWITTGPAFDKEGNIYVTPLYPAEEVVLISLEPDTGARRWAIPGTGGGSPCPMVLQDPASPGTQVIYQSLYEEVLAVNTDGTIRWQQPTGLTSPPGGTPPGENPLAYAGLGINYVPQADAIVVVMGNGALVALDRETGVQLLSQPYELPGEKSPEAPNPVTSFDQELQDLIEAELARLWGGAPEEWNINHIIQVLLGGNIEVANAFAMDPYTGRLWVNATAPDGEDGTVDGLSEYGAVYGLDLLPAGGGLYTVNEVCHISFEGGSGSTPALRADGERIYVGDAIGNLITFDRDCNELWRLDTGSQIYGSVGVSVDGAELYTSSRLGMGKVIDRGTYGEAVWQVQVDNIYDFGIWGALVPDMESFAILLPGIGANGLYVQAGAGLRLEDGTQQPFKTGYAFVDRQTGEVRYYAEGPEESVSVSAVDRNGTLYLAHSPVRRAISWAYYLAGLAPIPTDPLVGGVAKYGPKRRDLLIRDAACAAAARAQNAFDYAGTCTASAEADMAQIQGLIDQMRRVAPDAIAYGDLSSEDWDTFDVALVGAEGSLSVDTLDVAAGYLQEVCDFDYPMGEEEPPGWAPASTAGPELPPTSGSLNWLFALLAPIGALSVWKAIRRAQIRNRNRT